MPTNKNKTTLKSKVATKKKATRSSSSKAKAITRSKSSNLNNSFYLRCSEAIFWSGFFASIGIAIAVFRDLAWALLRYIFNINGEFNSYVVVLAPILGTIVLFSFLFDIVLKSTTGSKRSSGLMAAIASVSLFSFIVIAKGLWV